MVSERVETYRPCPNCGEQIKAAALICRFCRHDLRAPVSTPKQRFDWTRLRTPALVLGVLVAVAALSVGAFLVLDAKTQRDDSQAQLRELHAQNESTQDEMDDAQADLAKHETHLQKITAANTKLERRIAKLTTPSISALGD